MASVWGSGMKNRKRGRDREKRKIECKTERGK
jgi:hypothetical protein